MRADEKTYQRRQQPATSTRCYFCTLQRNAAQTITTTRHCIISRNTFPYQVWDGCGVKDHLLLSPQRHVNSLAELSLKERTDYINQVLHYEAKGYSIYTRSPSNASRSIAHQHAHFILTDNKPKKWLFYVRRPRIIMSK